LSDSPRSRSSECSWSQTDKGSQHSGWTRTKRIEEAASAKLFPVIVICHCCYLSE
jgi:hypothetical protein